MDKILDSVKRPCNISISDTSFDDDLILFINTTLGIALQIGVNEAKTLPVIDATTTWDELLGVRSDLEMLKTYIGLKVKIMFDPPTNSSAMTALTNTISELEWRITNLSTINRPVV